MKKDIVLFRTAVIVLCLSAFSLLLAFIPNATDNMMTIKKFVTGSLFWGGMIAGYVLIFIVNKHRKANTPEKAAGSKAKVGIITFFSGKPAIIADCAMFLSLVMTIVFTFVHVLNDSLWVIFFSILICSLHFHIIFNGTNFKYIKSIENKGE